MAKYRSERALNHKKNDRITNICFAQILARILPGFLLKIRPDSARIFTKMSPDEELGTLQYVLKNHVSRESIHWILL